MSCFGSGAPGTLAEQTSGARVQSLSCVHELLTRARSGCGCQGEARCHVGSIRLSSEGRFESARILELPMFEKHLGIVHVNCPAGQSASATSAVLLGSRIQPRARQHHLRSELSQHLRRQNQLRIWPRRTEKHHELEPRWRSSEPQHHERHERHGAMWQRQAS